MSKETADEGGEQTTEVDFLFDLISSFMTSPTWDNEILTFIDEHCILFDNEEENRLDHKEIHERFQEKVDDLLTEHLKGFDVTPEQFAEACEKARFANRNNKEVFEQLMSLEDFLVFKRLMCKRNMEIENEAVQLLHQMHVPIVGPGDEDEQERQFQMALKESQEMSVQEAQDILDKARAEQEASKEDDREQLEGAELDAQIRHAMDLNLMELEVQNRKFEMEDQELRQVMQMSLKMYEDRVRLAIEAERYEEERMSAEDAGVEGGGPRVTGSMVRDIFEDSDDDDDDDGLESSDDEPISAVGPRGPMTPQQRAEAKEGGGSPAPSSFSASLASPASGAKADSKDADAALDGGLSSSSPFVTSGGGGGPAMSPAMSSSQSPAVAMSPHSAAAASPGVSRGNGTPGSKDAGDDDGFGGRTSPLEEEDLSMAGTGIMADALTTVGPGLASPAQRSPGQRSPAVAMSSNGGRGDVLAEEEQQQEVGAFVLSEKKKKKKKKKKKQQREEQMGGGSTLSAPLAPLSGPGMGKGLAPLPSIGDLQKQMNKRRQEAEEAFRRNQDTLSQQRSKEAELAKAAGVTEQDAQRRAEYLKAQRDKIIAKKKAEREAKAKAYSAEQEPGRAMPAGLALQNPNGLRGGGGAAAAEEKDAGDDADDRRNAMRIALARRMKQDLLVNEEQRLQKIQEEQYSELDRQLRLVEQLREDNRQKEELLEDAIRMQQEQRFRNVQESVARDMTHG